mmetsp:Transcript_50700/g.146189  ORF Transcript_50700/g.146189 Transcript_50700/m.146189 type:complete len:148 (-) Transcript_50700:140-583(-)
MAGTMPFMSPEILKSGDSEPYMPTGCDIWAAAVVLLEMLCGFGKLNTMIGWETCEKPTPKCADDLQAYFDDLDRLYGALCADVIGLEDSLMDLFAGMFQLDWRSRLTAAQAERSDFVAAGPRCSKRIVAAPSKPSCPHSGSSSVELC